MDGTAAGKHQAFPKKKVSKRLNRCIRWISEQEFFTWKIPSQKQPFWRLRHKTKPFLQHTRLNFQPTSHWFIPPDIFFMTTVNFLSAYRMRNRGLGLIGPKRIHRPPLTLITISIGMTYIGCPGGLIVRMPIGFPNRTAAHAQCQNHNSNTHWLKARFHITDPTSRSWEMAWRWMRTPEIFFIQEWIFIGPAVSNLNLAP